jgi:hypothetical protein
LWLTIQRLIGRVGWGAMIYYRISNFIVPEGHRGGVQKNIAEAIKICEKFSVAPKLIVSFAHCAAVNRNGGVLGL